MRNPKSPFWLALCALWLAACVAQAVNIGGQITDSTNGGVSFFGVSGVTVSTGANSAVTDAGGFYTITGLQVFSTYTFTPAQSGVTFVPSSQSVVVVSQTNINFSVAHTISGQVTKSGLGLFGAELTAGTNSASTDGHGNYTLAGLAPGEATVMPSVAGYTFNPTNQNVAVGGNKTGINFTATPNGTVCIGNNTLPGVDVSQYVGAVNWTNVKAAGIVFAYAEATEGTSITDPQFAANWSGMKAAGVVRGAYAFFHANMDPATEAAHFVAAVGTLQPGDLPPMLDVEVTDGQSAAMIAANVNTWVNLVLALTGRAPLIFTTPSFWNGSVGGSTASSSFPLWISDWGATCPGLPVAWTNWVFWQFANNGTVAGITNAVDLDEFNGSMSDLLALADEPSLNIAPQSANDISITWSTFATGFMLQRNSNLNTTNWVNVTNTPNVISNQKQVILGTSNNPTFFRLFHP